MATVISQNAQVGGQPSFASGTVTADVDAILYISCGFQPSKIEIFGTSTNEGVFHALWVKGMTAGTFLQTVNHADTQHSLVTTYGPKVFAGDDDESQGFYIPVDFQDATGLNMADDDAMYWIAYP